MSHPLELSLYLTNSLLQGGGDLIVLEVQDSVARGQLVTTVNNLQIKGYIENFLLIFVLSVNYYQTNFDIYKCCLKSPFVYIKTKNFVIFSDFWIYFRKTFEESFEIPQKSGPVCSTVLRFIR